MDQGPTFISRTGQGFPDLSLISTSCQDLLEFWRVLDMETFSDHSLVHPHQFGFRELSNCEVAVNHLVTKIKASREGCHVALVSVDIRAAFDSLDWIVLFKLFDKHNFPYNIRSFVYSYLKNRTMSFPVLNEVVSKGPSCPQGSVLAPPPLEFLF
ncbi:hypothetical protein AVEN_244940-1 [Araneus ventricosus]|uniref:Reverse transcriptase domain-containing protein n=1 Tax=Araneus ventricosus TaxID=182803 RepID=A0A4Y2F8D1_ARAVE|nr:hypothetical protein AVEN_244940-1 [Araneus ventricosus]